MALQPDREEWRQTASGVEVRGRGRGRGKGEEIFISERDEKARLFAGAVDGFLTRKMGVAVSLWEVKWREKVRLLK